MGAKGDLGRQQAKSLKAREAICDATVESLFAHGYSETSLKRVAEIAGCSKGAVQHHFPTKQDLIAQVTARLLQRPFVNPAKEWERAETVAESLLALWSTFINTEAYRALMEIVVACWTDQDLNRRIAPGFRTWNRSMDRWAQDHYRAISGDDGEVEELLTLSRCMMRGLLLQDHFAEDPDATTEHIRRWIELVAPRLEIRQPGDTAAPSSISV